ncbi:MAG: hypothetical protein K0R41_1578 [Geminicoccaceae bacterium]|nr:hypothetical protein [Geminicoccaceae bacterium]
MLRQACLSDHDLPERGRPLVARQRRPEARVDVAPDHRVSDVEEGQDQPRQERGREQLDDRDADDRAHHHEHHARRDQDAERAASGDRTGRHLRVVAGADHRRRRHHAHHRHRGADDAGRGREDRRGQQHAQIERAAKRGEDQLERLEQPLHQPSLLEQVPHEDEQRHRRERLLLHQADGLEDHKVEDRVAEADVAEHDRQHDQREGDRKADENPGQQRAEQDQAEHLAAHSGLPVRAA